MNRLIIIILLLIVIAFGAREYNNYKHQYKIAYVELGALYDSFTFKKELETKLINIKQTRANILDSIKLQLKVMMTTLKTTDEKGKMLFEAQRQNYFEKEKTFSEDNEALTRQFSSEVMKQMNQYVQEYGKEHGYTYILGADGSGNIMFADTKENVTTEVLAYLNDKYKGKK
jgi:outer membrane protein